MGHTSPVILLGRDLLVEFYRKHPATASWVRAWVSEVEAAEWKRPVDVRQRYATASLIGEKTVVFNVKGNDYRLEVEVLYQQGIVLVKRAGTHGEYDRWNR